MPSLSAHVTIDASKAAVMDQVKTRTRGSCGEVAVRSATSSANISSDSLCMTSKVRARSAGTDMMSLTRVRI